MEVKVINQTAGIKVFTVNVEGESTNWLALKTKIAETLPNIGDLKSIYLQKQFELMDDTTIINTEVDSNNVAKPITIYVQEQTRKIKSGGFDPQTASYKELKEFVSLSGAAKEYIKTKFLKNYTNATTTELRIAAVECYKSPVINLSPTVIVTESGVVLMSVSDVIEFLTQNKAAYTQVGETVYGLSFEEISDEEKALIASYTNQNVDEDDE